MDKLDYLNNSILGHLNKLRDEIGNIDKQIVKLFEKRMNTVLKVDEIKKDNINSIMRISRDIQKEYINSEGSNTYIEKEKNSNKDCINMKNTILSNNDTLVVGFQVSILFSLSHKPKALFNTLKYFSKNNLNLLKIESIPIIDKPWEYFFYIDFEGCFKHDIIKETIDLIKNNSLYFKLLGNYKSFESNIIKNS